jgi:hypothetical protein
MYSIKLLRWPPAAQLLIEEPKLRMMQHTGSSLGGNEASANPSNAEIKQQIDEFWEIRHRAGSTA